MKWIVCIVSLVFVACGETAPEPDLASDSGLDVPEDMSPVEDAAVEVEEDTSDVADDRLSEPDVPDWDESVIAVPGVCAALDRDALFGGALVEHVLYCARRCSTVECARACSRGISASVGCTQCIEAGVSCLTRNCDCPYSDDCELCFASECEDEWILCAGVVTPDSPTRAIEIGCDVSQAGALSSPLAPDSVRTCSAECPATSGRKDCIESCFAARTGAALPCARCLSNWVVCSGTCSECQSDPMSDACFRCAPVCAAALEECTGGLLEVTTVQPRPGRIRLLNISGELSATLVNAADGRPVVRRIVQESVSGWREEEVGARAYGLTNGSVGADAMILGTTSFELQTESSWTIVAQDVGLLATEERAEPGVRLLRVLNATLTPGEFWIGSNAPVTLAPSETSDWVRITGSGGTVEAEVSGFARTRYTSPAPGPTASWTAVYLDNAEAPHGGEVLLLVEEGTIRGALEFVLSDPAP